MPLNMYITFMSILDNPVLKELFGDIAFEPMNFVRNLYYMGVGMAGIILVMGVLIAITTLLNKFFSKTKKKDKNDK